jgi:hypothetical protein
VDGLLPRYSDLPNRSWTGLAGRCCAACSKLMTLDALLCVLLRPKHIIGRWNLGSSLCENSTKVRWNPQALSVINVII